MNEKPMTKEQALENVKQVVNQARLNKEEWRIMDRSMTVLREAIESPPAPAKNPVVVEELAKQA